MSRGGRNLLILGFGAIFLAGVTTVASLMIYRTSGDIYLDRSRPGYLPDDDEVSEEPADPINYTFSENGELNAAELDEYLKELQNVNNRLKNYADPFSPAPLSDESLGIPSELKEGDTEDTDDGDESLSKSE